jgi:NIMA (never in mitosis gene a)-related kinase
MQLLMGLEYIHNKHIIHRLIASRNVYLNHQGDLKIGSFGSAKVLENTLKKAVTVVTMPCNMSPEMVQGEPYTNKADIWALGCLIFEMASFKVIPALQSLFIASVISLNFMI